MSRVRGETQGQGGGESEGEGHLAGGWGGDVGTVGTGHETQGVWLMVISLYLSNSLLATTS